MIYQKNLPRWERWLRFFAGSAMITCGLLGIGFNVAGFVLAGFGVISGLTAFFGFCPACSLAGRKRK
jgi:Protein of unknown function (DUF2892)